MRFIHIADVHLGCRPDIGFSWGESREKEIWETFASIIKVCAEEKVDLLLISGDLFDHQPSVDELKRVNNMFAKISRVQVVLISGERDYVKQDSAYMEFDWANNVSFLSEDEPDSVFLEEIDTTVHGISYSSEENTERIAESILPNNDEGEIQILMLHGGDNEHMPFSPKTLKKADFDYIALGHVHTLRSVSECAVYPGSPEPLGREEIGKHGYILGEFTDEGLEIQFVPVSKREYVQLTVRVSSDIEGSVLEERLKSVIEKQGAQHLYLITLEGKYRPRQPYNTERLQKIGNIVEVDDRTVPDYDLLSLLDEHKDDVVGMYMEELLKQPSNKTVQRALFCGLDALLFQEDPN